MTAFVVQGDGIVLSGDGRTAQKNARFYSRYSNRVVIPPATVKAIVAQRGASVAIPPDTIGRGKSEGDIITVKGVVGVEKYMKIVQ